MLVDTCLLRLLLGASQLQTGIAMQIGLSIQHWCAWFHHIFSDHLMQCLWQVAPKTPMSDDEACENNHMSLVAELKSMCS